MKGARTRKTTSADRPCNSFPLTYPFEASPLSSFTHMRLQKITLREIHLRLLSPFETSFGKVQLRRILLVEAQADGVTGWGESTAGEGPFYSYETVETAWLILSKYIWPMLKGREFGSASEIWDLLDPVRGHNMAKAALETALWDAEAKQKGVPLAKLLGGTLEEIPCGVSIGLQPTMPELLAKVEKELAAGYQRIKIKIKPGADIALVSTLRDRFPRIRLMVDANSAYTLKDTALLKALDAFYLIMIEQPLGWDDIFSHVQLQRELETPICLDECIHELDHARAAIETKACRIINIKLGRVGGHTAARRIHDLCQANSIPVWCGGMLESGIGRAHNIAMSSLPNFNLPGDVSASRRYWEEDVIEPEVEVSKRGTIRVPTTPGIGYTPRIDRIDSITHRREILE
jgi:O-succinylbenzoate synthase